ncbi:WecB/TagA/CpsF family glycosyltransferase [Novosphingobium sp. AAP93]|uniref:WecB/TagA/CpsF family glycosyltransferase n=1 Tax=Novosphingobium sp. AAP93 TaxID=1523427 RepID=UPI000B19F56A|nr:WecB/TagA/CpsF family glycosyltransferase [Novosphingobium sp. AAP93]
MLLSENQKLREAYDRAWCVTIDSGIFFAYARRKGIEVPERVTGSDLVSTLIPLLDPALHRPFFLVSNHQIGGLLEEFLTNKGFSPDLFKIEVPDFGFERDAGYGESLSTRIRDARSTHLFMGVGCPKSEIWVDEYRDRLMGLYALCVGAGLGYFVGYEMRAPQFMRRIGFEWVWRLLKEPQRLGKRYIVRGAKFLNILRKDISKGNFE